MANPLEGNVRMFRGAAQDLASGFATLNANIKQAQVQRLLTSANERVQEIQGQEANEAKQRQALTQLSQQLAFGLAGLGVNPAQAATFTEKTLDPQKDLRERLTLQAASGGGGVDRNLAVPGFGQGINKASVGKFTAQVEGAQKSLRSIQQLRAINNQGAESLSPDARARAQSIRQQLVGQSRLAIVGPGAVSEVEREAILETIPAVADFFEVDSRSEAKLQELERSLAASIVDSGRAAGFNEQAITQNLLKFGVSPNIMHQVLQGSGGSAAPQSQTNTFPSQLVPLGR